MYNKWQKRQTHLLLNAGGRRTRRAATGQWQRLSRAVGALRFIADDGGNSSIAWWASVECGSAACGVGAVVLKHGEDRRNHWAANERHLCWELRRGQVVVRLRDLEESNPWPFVDSIISFSAHFHNFLVICFFCFSFLLDFEAFKFLFVGTDLFML
ncbi:unnamed protein product [Vicia faba]|uniref:Uncharacterized protein n=1 Tax=Vicia faba TaxID=3906 RepID=A0AAV0YQ65_VICFA|nr:unnamed protein product [Vicia faba]